MNMNAVLDMTNLRDIIDDDKVLEAELVRNFHACYRTCVVDMEDSLHSNNPVQWRNAAHALKGVALNLGAEQLSALSYEAELASTQSLTHKAPLLAGIKAAYSDVEQALAVGN